MKKLLEKIIIATLFLNMIGFYFISNSYDIFGIIDYEDFLTIYNILIFMLLSYVIKDYKNHNSKYGFWMITIIFLCFLSSLQAKIIFDQSFIDGLLIQKELISAALLYFPLSKIINNDLIKKDKLFKILDRFAIIQLVLFITQYFLADKISFLAVHTAQRYGEIRFYFNPILLDLFLIRNLNSYINTTNKHKVMNIFWIGLVLFEIMVVQKYRLTSIALIITIIVGMVISKTKIINKFIYIISAGVFSAIMVNTKIVQDLISEFTVQNKTFTYSIREIGRNLYMQMLNNHPILGGGYPVSATARDAAGYNNLILLDDNGIFGFAYIYGALGLIWAISLLLKILKNGFKILNKTKNLVYFLFPLLFIITCVNELHWYWQHGFIIFVIFLIMMEEELKTIK